MIAFIRGGERPEHSILVVCNFTPAPRLNYRVGVPRVGKWREILNSDAQPYGGRLPKSRRRRGRARATARRLSLALFDPATARCTLP
ncbi:MAG: alpha amylase C-terminal domain-containing protein [Pseudomonadota bacterium]|nr:alpha amylase C-terminal domain-containing protein [Pseudomonadota bacterium]